MKPIHRYFPVSDTQRAWGLYTTCAGINKTKPHVDFPSPTHPDEYYFSYANGRILHEWQFIMIKEGRGNVEFKHRRYAAKEGSLIVLSPGNWHRYRPLKKVGWTTIWIGFGGDFADRLVGAAGFDPEGCVLDIRHLHRFQHHLSQMVTDIIENGQDNPYSMAARIPQLIATLIEERNNSESKISHAELIHRAQTHIVEHATEIIDFEALSATVGMPYRTFRHVFAKETGTSPHQYQLEIRLNRAKNLLKFTDMPISKISQELGFRSIWNFTHFFTKRTSISAASYRKKHLQTASQ